MKAEPAVSGLEIEATVNEPRGPGVTAKELLVFVTLPSVTVTEKSG